ncbi:MAG: hypothetical protein EOO04_34480, partial [Chitinophagaceae bacterium]
MNISKDNNIGAVVAEDYRTAGIFEQAGIDFCCNGNRTIAAACGEKKIATDELVMKLQQAVEAPVRKDDAVSSYKSWPLDLLTDFIEKKHHRYVTSQIPVIQAFLEKIAHVHGERHPELAEIKVDFDSIKGNFGHLYSLANTINLNQNNIL